MSWPDCVSNGAPAAGAAARGGERLPRSKSAAGRRCALGLSLLGHAALLHGFAQWSSLGPAAPPAPVIEAMLLPPPALAEPAPAPHAGPRPRPPAIERQMVPPADARPADARPASEATPHAGPAARAPESVEQGSPPLAPAAPAAATPGAALGAAAAPGAVVPPTGTTASSGPPAQATLPAVAPRFGAAYLHNPPPAYPAAARRLGEQGQVLLRVLVGADGAAERVEVGTGSGSARLDRAAVEAVQRWRFVPARQGAEAVAAWVTVPIHFQLEH
jgi:protein TonB